MKKLKLTFLLCLSGTFFSLHAQTVIDEIIAIVADKIITKYDVEYALQSYKYQSGLYTLENEDELRCDILEQLIFQKMLLNQAELDSIEISEDQITQRIESSLRMQIARAGSVKRLEDAYGKSINEIKKDARKLVREDFLTSQVQQSITASINVNYQDVRDYYEKIPKDSLPVIEVEYELAEISMIPKISLEEKNAIKEKLNEYRNRILRGENFTTFARLYSEDPGSASKGGELGFVGRGTLYSEFEQVAFELKPGEISPIVETKAGFHIIRMIERRGEMINVAHILLKPKPSVDAMIETQMKLDSIYKKIINHEISFDSAAHLYSEAPNKINGGKMLNPYTSSYYFTEEQLDKNTLYNIKKLKDGECSQVSPYITDEGNQAYRLIMLIHKKPEHIANMTDDYEKIKNAALEAKKQNALVKWAKNKVKYTHIDINENYRNCDLSKNLGIE